MLPRFTVPRLLVIVSFVSACSLVHEVLPSPWRSAVVFVVIAGGARILRHWAHLDRSADEGDSAVFSNDVPADTGGPRVYRVRWWVRLVSVAVPLLGLPFVLEPRLLNPSWESGMPAGELAGVVLVYASLGLGMWAAFRSRLVVDEDVVQVINPWRARSLPRGQITGVRAGPWGLRLLLGDGQVVVSVAVQCVGGFRAGYRPRWVEVGRTITGHDPV